MGGLSRADNLLGNFAKPTSVCGILGAGDCPKMCKMMMIFAQNSEPYRFHDDNAFDF
jgi:hypothetical protein